MTRSHASRPSIRTRRTVRAAILCALLPLIAPPIAAAQRTESTKRADGKHTVLPADRYFDPDASLRADDDANNSTRASELQTLRATESAAGTNVSCFALGGLDQRFNGSRLYRGNLVRPLERTRILEWKMLLSFEGETDLYFSVHRFDTDEGLFLSLDNNVMMQRAGGDGLDRMYSTGPLGAPLDLEPGALYAFGVSWGSEAIVSYQRSNAAAPRPFPTGQVEGLITITGIEPPIPPAFNATTSAIGTYAMELCLPPETGACCADGTCTEILEEFCTAPGSFFHGERTECGGVVCNFGACCDTCDITCNSPYTPQACASIGGVHTPGANCPGETFPELCGAAFGACILPDRCEEICAFDCDQFGGNFQGEGTICTEVAPFGACCTGDRCIDDLSRFGCEDLRGGTYEGDGSSCLLLPPPDPDEEPCTTGGCCFGPPYGCVELPPDLCTVAVAGEPVVYLGDGVACPSPSTAAAFCQNRIETPSLRGACCLPDGTCLNTVSSYCQREWVAGTFNDADFCGGLPITGEPFFSCGPAETPCCIGDQCIEVLNAGVCTFDFGGTVAPGTACGPDSCDESGACCDLLPGECSDGVTQLACESGGGVWRGRGSECIGASCEGFGACCFTDGRCEGPVSLNTCELLGGSFSGVGSRCESQTCVDLRGACCTVTGGCEFITNDECDEIGGAYDGEASCTTPGICPAGACCSPFGDCRIRPPDVCASSAGIYAGNGTLCTGGTCTRGACCRFDGTCDDNIELSECEGETLIRTLCAERSEPCPLLGACCNTMTGVCTNDVAEADCSSDWSEGETCGNVECAGCSAVLLATNPPNCAIDARYPHDPSDADALLGWNEVQLTFTCIDPAWTTDDFVVTTQAPAPRQPVVTSILALGNVLTIVLDEPIPPGVWTCLDIVPLAESVCLGALPGDVNADRTAGAPDITALIDQLNGVANPPIPLRGCNIDRIGTACGAPDITALIDLLNGAAAFQPWLGATLSACPSAP